MSISVVRFQLVWLSMLAAFIPLGGFAQTAPERVGARSEIRTIQFSGNTTFTADQLRGGLIGDPDFLIASHPLAPLRECAELLKSRLTRGYRVSGFPDVMVEVTRRERFQVRIVEGPRFMTGEIRIQGAKKVPVEVLVKRLKERFPPFDELRSEPDANRKNVYRDRTGKTIEVQPPAWEKANPAPFGNEGQIEAQIRKILSELGFLEPVFAVRIARPPAPGAGADLLVDFKNEGEPARLSEIVIRGNEKNSREELLQFLRLANGMPATATLASDTEFLLYQSGHFKTAEVKLEPFPPNRARMTIQLAENQFSPKLGPYTRAEKALLAFREWLEKVAQRREVIELNAQISPEVRSWFALSGDDAFAGRIEKFSPGDARVQYSLGFVMSSNGSGFFSPVSGTKYFVAKPRMYTFAGVSLSSSKEESTTSHIGLYGGINSRRDESDPNFRLETQWEPAPFIVLAHPTNGTLNFEAGVVELKTSNTVLRVEEATGKLLRFTGGEGAYSATVGNASAIPAFLEGFENHKNVYDAQRPHSTFFAYLIGESFEAAVAFGFLKVPSEEVSKRAGMALRKLIRAETFTELDEFLKTDEELERFYIPVDLNQAVTQDALAAILAGFVFRGANVVFPENSWPWTVAREAVFVLKGQTQYTGEQLDRLFASEMGPVGFYVTATLLNRLQPELARRFALRGMTRLQGTYFAEDCKLLFAGETALSRSAGRLARDIRLLDEVDVGAVEALFPGSGKLLRAAAAQARKEAKAEEVLTPLLEHLWENRLKARFRKAFQQLAFGEEGDQAPAKP
jgi:hypothetical protein